MTGLPTPEPPEASSTSTATSSAAASDAVIDGINVDAVARAVQACTGVSGLHGGRFGEMASYLRGRRVPGVIVGPHVVTVQIKGKWGVPAGDLRSQITPMLSPLVDRPIQILVADIDDPPSTTDAPSTARPPQTAGAPPPALEAQPPGLAHSTTP